jgi:tetratricopeptide (TPR) repeat protein
MSKPKDALIAIVSLLIVGTAGVWLYRSVTDEPVAGDLNFRLGNRYMESGEYEKALAAFDAAIESTSGNAAFHMGRAIALMQLERYRQARESFDVAVTRDPHFGEAYANRGIFLDRTGHYEEAIRDYRKALELKGDLDKGPGRMWRFLHRPGEHPSTLSERAAYLEAELMKPPEERVLRIPDLDREERMYTP